MNGKLLVVIGSLDYGGAERHLVQMLPRLVRRGWRVKVFTLAQPGEQAPLLAAQDIEVRGPPSPPRPERGRLYRMLRLAAATASLLACLRRYRPDIVHFFLPQAYLTGAPCALLLGHGKLVMSRRSRNLYQRRHPYASGFERWLHRRMTAVLGNSLAVIADLRGEGVEDKRLGLIYNGVDPAAFAAPTSARAKCRREFGLPPDALVLIKVANLIPYKGHADLIDAMALARLPEPWRVLCIGRDQGVLGELEARARNAGVSDNFIWAGPRVDVPELLAAADIGLLCSHEEGFTFNFTRYGLLHGKVISISQDAITRDKPQEGSRTSGAAASGDSSSGPQGQELSYAARVSLDRDTMQVENKTVRLTPGMAVTVEIKTGSRRVISYLLSPVLRYKQAAFRER